VRKKCSCLGRLLLDLLWNDFFTLLGSRLLLSNLPCAGYLAHPFEKLLVV